MFHSLAPGAPFHLCPPTDVMSDLELQQRALRSCFFAVGLGGGGV